MVSYIVTKPTMVIDGEDKENRASYTSDMFAMVGTLFLFLYWPSFNGGLLDSATNQQERALVNTVISLAGSCMATFLFTKCMRGHFCMVSPPTHPPTHPPNPQLTVAHSNRLDLLYLPVYTFNHPPIHLLPLNRWTFKTPPWRVVWRWALPVIWSSALEER